MEVWQDFGQKIDLAVRIRDILHDYPEGTSVLKELIQNADDAGATTIRFCLDERQHKTDRLAAQSLASFQGPALLAYNDAVFSEADFQSISSIGQSVKREQKGKTGRFGVGFNASYHLSDVVSFISGSQLVIFDPHCTYLPNITPQNPGKRIDFVQSSAAAAHPDQFAPYQAFGCDAKSYFRGTIFRFPLRTAEQATTSRISKQVYKVEGVRDILEDLQREAVSALLFLKNLQRLEVYEWGRLSAQPSRLYSCHLSNASPDILADRRFFTAAAARAGSDSVGQSASLSSYLAIFESQSSASAEADRQTFLISQSCGGAASNALAAEAAKAFNVSVVPFAAVAGRLAEPDAAAAKPLTGQAFCFLPITTTDLPVHVNGFFELSSNRRDIWHGKGMAGVGQLRCDWNISLLKDVAAPAYANLLAEAAKGLGPSPAFYKLWPVQLVREPWAVLVTALYQELPSRKVVHTAAGGGKWLAPDNAVYVDGAVQRDSALVDALIAVGVPIASGPPEVTRMLVQHTVQRPQLLCPASLRVHIRSAQRATLAACSADKSRAAVLLAYCLQDLDETDPESCLELVGLPLLPLMNGTIKAMERVAPGQDAVYICSAVERKLLGAHAACLVDSDALSRETADRLTAVACTGCLDLQLVDSSALVDVFLPRLLPRFWQGQALVSWNAGADGAPTADWIALLWQQLQAFDDLSVFSPWPLLPTASGELAALTTLDRSLLVWEPDDTTWEPPVTSALTKLGIRLVSSRAGVAHHKLHRHVHLGTGRGVLAALEVVFAQSGPYAGSHAEELFQRTGISQDERHALRRLLLQERWLRGHPEHFDVLRHLPIFETASSASESRESGSPASFITLLGQAFIAPAAMPSSALPTSFVAFANDAERNALQLLGVQPLSRSEVLRRHVLGRLPDQSAAARQAIMLYALSHLPLMVAEDHAVLDHLRVTPFVDTESGKLQPPGILYDPRKPELVALLDSSSSFPAGPFASEEALASLQRLGLRSTVSTATLLDSARSVVELAARDQEAARARGQLLLEYLEMEAGRLLGPSQGQQSGVESLLNRVTAFRQAPSASPSPEAARFWAEMGGLAWCPVLAEAPFEGLPWPKQQELVAPPRAMRPLQDLWLCSGTMCILAADCRTAVLADGLGWSAPVNGSVVGTQLASLGAMHPAGQAADVALQQRLARAVPQIYTCLSSLSRHDMEVVSAILSDAPCVWTGNGFVPVARVAFRGPLNLSPWLYCIPGDLQPFRQVLAELGVAESFTADQYVGVLADMAAAFGKDPLSAAQQEQAVSVLQALSDMRVNADKLYILDSRSVLAPASDLVYNDAPWVPDQQIRFVHPKLSNEVSEKLGVKSLRRMMLADSADTVPLGLHSVEAFGQSEALTTRLKHIIDDYADGPGILMELLQNADDAGASEVSFLLDNQQYGTNSVLAPRMAAWQGPALLCFNDAVFTPSDFRNISRIGQDTKVDRPATTGRFGLGFNAVYHWTDLPAFVSGDYLVMFDPHAKWLPGTSPAQPGLKIAFQRANLLSQFPDAFQPFLHFNCSLRDTYPGTLFRFPLRTEELAKQSEIKGQAYTPSSVLSLFEGMRAQVERTLLFLKSVRSAAVYVRDAGDEAPRLLFRASMDTQDGRSSQAAICRFIGEGGRVQREAFYQRLAKAGPAELPAAQTTATVTIEDLHGEEQRKLVQTWLISNALGGSRARRMAVQMQKAGRGLVPWAGVAVPVQLPPANALEPLQLRNNEHEQLVQNQSAAPAAESTQPLVGRAFCFLPLPCSTGLPVHVNGYFELSSNRRNIWFSDLPSDLAGQGKVRSDWNLVLLEDLAAPLYAGLLAESAQRLGPTPAYFALWPPANLAPPWSNLVTQLYKEVASLKVVWTDSRGGRWVTPTDALLPDEACTADPELAAALSMEGMPLVTGAPAWLLSAWLSKVPGIRTVTPAAVRSHLRAKGAGLALAQRPAEERAEAAAAVLSYCLSGLPLSAPKAVQQLAGLHIVHTMQGGLTALQPSEAGVAPLLLATGEQQELLPSSQAALVLHCKADSVLGGKLLAVAGYGAMNIKALSAESLAETLLPELLPRHWRGQETVTWDPQAAAADGHFTADTLCKLWSLLATLPDLSALQSWPLVPAHKYTLSQLGSPSKVVEEGAWAEGVSSALARLGVRVLDGSILPPAAMGSARALVNPATGCGVLSAISNAAGGDLGRIGRRMIAEGVTTEERQQLRAFLIQERWFSGPGCVTPAQQSVVKALPIFEAAAGAAAGDASAEEPAAAFLDLLEGRYLALDGTDEALLGPGFLKHVAAGEARVLVERLGVQLLTHQQLITDHVLPRLHNIAPAARDTAMLHLLDSIQAVLSSNPALAKQLSTTAFVPIKASLAAPVSLYDPRNEEMVALLDADTHFPSGPFRKDDKVLDALKALGLRSEVSSEMFLDAARSLDSLKTTPEKDVDRASLLLEKLDEVATQEDVEDQVGNDLSGNEGDFWEKMKMLCWCPVVTVTPHPDMPFARASGHLAPPRIARRVHEAWLCSASLRLVNGNPGAALASRLGWAGPLPATTLGAQLLELGRLHPQVEDDMLLGILEDSAVQIYAGLQARLDDAAECDAVRVMLEDSACVWAGRGFVPANRALLSLNHDCTPYLHHVPEAVAPYKQLLAFLGVADGLKAAHATRALQDMAKEQGLTSLSQKELSVVVHLARSLAEMKAGGASIHEQVWLPDSEGVMALARHIFFDDAPWLAGGGQRLVHRDIPNDVAEALGCQSLRYHHQVNTRMTADLPCAPASMIAPLLTAAAEDMAHALLDIAELADAVGAETMEVTLDYRQHGVESLLLPGLADFQGPAICITLPGVVLSREELCQLQCPGTPYRVRGRNCRCGTGLLSSYNLTDLPMAISGDSLYIWDPHGHHLSASGKKGTGASAAKQYQHVGGESDLVARFADQFSAWDFGGPSVDISSKLDCTLIRLPLRSATQAPGSSVCQDVWDVEQAAALIRQFSAHCGRMMLFMESLRCIRTQHTLQDSAAVPLSQVSLVPHEPGRRVVFDDKDWRHKSLGQLVRGHRFPGIRKTLSFTIVTTSGDKKDVVPELWLVCANAGMGAARDLAVDRRYAALQLDPTAAVAVRYDNIKDPKVLPAGGLFAPVPLHLGSPANTAGALADHLPFLVYGAFAISRSGGRHIAGADSVHRPPMPPQALQQTQELLAAFNQDLIATGVVTAWSDAFGVLLNRYAIPGSSRLRPCSAIYDMVPSGSHGTHDEKEALVMKRAARTTRYIAAQVCEDIARKPLWQLRDGRMVGLSQGCFIQPNADVSELGAAALDFIQRKLPLFNVPWHVKTVLEAAGMKDCSTVTPKAVRPLLKQMMKSGDGVSGLNPTEAAELLHFCFQDICSLMKELQLMPPLPDPPGQQPSATQQERNAAETPQPPGPPQNLLDEILGTAANNHHVQATMSYFRDVLGMEAGAAARAAAPVHQRDLPAQRAPEEAPNAEGPASASVSSEAEAAMQKQRQLSGLLQECVGLPTPTASSRIVALGTRRLYMLPQQCPLSLIDVLPKDIGLCDSLLHPLVVEPLGECLHRADVADVVMVQPFTLRAAALALQQMLPHLWATGNSVCVAWQDGTQGGPTPEKLLQLWQLLMALRDPLPSGDVALLDRWPLIPNRCARGTMVRVAHRALIFCPPDVTHGAGTSIASAQVPTQVHNSSAAGEADLSDQWAEIESASSLDGLEDQDLEINRLPRLDLQNLRHRLDQEMQPLLTEEEPASGTAEGDSRQQADHIEGRQGSSAMGQAMPARPNADLLAETEVEEPAGPWEWLLPILERLALPVLDTRFGMLAPVCALDGQLSEQDTILRKLQLCSEAGLFQVDQLGQMDCEHLFGYFAQHVPLTEEPSQLDFLRCIPIFPALLPGRRVALNSGQQAVATCPPAVITAAVGDVNALPEQVQGMLLDLRPQYEPLYRALGVPTMSKPLLMAKYVLPHFSQLAPPAQDHALEKILQQWPVLRNNVALFDALTNTPFVLTATGERRHARDLYNPAVALLARTFRDRPVFPTAQFATPGWTEVLKQIGLRCEVDSVTFLACARELESWGLSMAKMDEEQVGESMAVARELVQEFRSNTALHSSELFTALRDIAFVPATKGLPGSHEARAVLVKHSHAALHKDWPLAWAAAPILEEGSVPPATAWTALGLRSPPLFSTMLQHLRALSSDAGQGALSSWPARGPTVDEAFGSILDYISAQGLNPAQAKELSHLALIPVANGTRLVPPSSLYVRLRDDLSPFAFELPTALVGRSTTLQELGMKAAPSAADLISFLKGLRRTLGSAPLNINEVRAVLRLLRYICKHKDPELLRLLRQAQAADGVLVPAADSRLVPASACAHTLTCPPHLLSRAAECVVCAHPQLPLDICQLLGITALEDIAYESLNEAEPLQYQNIIQGQHRRDVQQLLKSHEMARAVHQVVSPYAKAVPALALSVKDVRAILSGAADALHFVIACQTTVHFKASRAVIAQKTPSMQVYEFTSTASGAVFIADPPPGIQLATLLSRALSRALRSPLALPLEPLLSCAAADLPAVREALLPAAATTSGGLELARLGAAGKLGTTLLPSDQALVQLKPLRPFAAGELCAYLAGASPAALAARAAQQRANGLTGVSGGGQVLCYGRVARDARPEEGAAVFRVSVEVSASHFAYLLSSEVYSFRGGSAGPGPAGAAQDAGQPPHDAPATPGADDPISNGATKLPQASEAVSEQLAVEPREVVSAIRDMLSAADLPLGLERERLLEHSLSLQAQLKATQAGLSHQRQAADSARTEGEAAREAWRCRICLSADVDAVLTTCGHALCWDCGSACRQRCPFCRTHSPVIRLYK